MPVESEISSVYGLIGDAGFERLCAAFYRQIPTDELLGPLYPLDDLAGAEHRLRSFLIFRFGGPDRYLQERGHPQLSMVIRLVELATHGIVNGQSATCILISCIGVGITYRMTLVSFNSHPCVERVIAIVGGICAHLRFVLVAS